MRRKELVERASSGRLLTTHGLFDQPDDHHQDPSSNAAGSDLADNGTNIEASRAGRVGTAAEKLTDDLRANPAPDDTRDRIADSPQVVLL
jgi:hypothetical protein